MCVWTIPSDLPRVIPSLFIEVASSHATHVAKSSAFGSRGDLNAAGLATPTVFVHFMDTLVVCECDESTARLASQVRPARVAVSIARPRNVFGNVRVLGAAKRAAGPGGWRRWKHWGAARIPCQKRQFVIDFDADL